MKNIYRHTETGFEYLTSLATTIMGNSVTFIIAVVVVLIFLTQSQLGIKSYHGIIGDIILGVTFLNLFIIQKTTNRFAASLHLKVNELVASHKTAHNSVMNAEHKTEQEMTELTKEYTDLAELIEDEIKVLIKPLKAEMKEILKISKVSKDKT